MIFQQIQSHSSPPSTPRHPAPPPVQASQAPLPPISTHTCGSGECCSPTHEQIALAAYDIYLAHGRSEGRSQLNWLQAEEELAQTPRASQPRTPAHAKA